jgi:hypothetical protein
LRTLKLPEGFFSPWRESLSLQDSTKVSNT